ncbi:hypothetical protein [Georgenia faecalis]|uniref:hypothetical protein n=1 Tax=Georgenia faecalis TaxID=2483799 RepID=UPI0013DEEE4B|nr:hypothetical protein [Georgenia faecalis]
MSAAVLALALAGCSADDTPNEAPTTEQTSPAETASEGATDTPKPEDTATGDAATDDVVDEVTYTLPGTEDEVTVGVLPLEVEGDVMTLRLVFTPNFASVGDNEPVAVYDMYPDNLFKFRPVLVDRENLKEYSPISDTGIDWTAQSSQLEAVNGESVVWWGVYAAPEDDIDTFDLRLRDSLPEYTDIPVP